MTYFVYLMTNLNHSVFYTGVTSNLEDCVFQHKTGLDKRSFTFRYNCVRLIYYEEFENIVTAIDREKQLKRYKRSFKINLIASMNPDWKDLSEDWFKPEEFELSRKLNKEKERRKNALRDSKK